MQKDKMIRNLWQADRSGRGTSVARILDRHTHVEGLDIKRIKTDRGGKVPFDSRDGHIVSLIRGAAGLSMTGEKRELHIQPVTHMYLPPESGAVMALSAGSQLIWVAGPHHQARGKALLIRSETYLKAGRFILTPQYLSRRAFVHRDRTLLSKNGDPVSWFHTTMFDTRGLPENVEGRPVLKMSYNHQTEPNVIYAVAGRAAVRFAVHPYGDKKSQVWGPWFDLDDQTTYHLNEGAASDALEWCTDPDTKARSPLRNRHEVSIERGGHVALCCLFDPAPTGLEQHLPGEYSAYAPVAETLRTPTYASYLKKVTPMDEMMDFLSLMEARGELEAAKATPHWQRYLDDLRYQKEQEKALMRKLHQEGKGRDAVIGPWRIQQS